MQRSIVNGTDYIATLIQTGGIQIGPSSSDISILHSTVDPSSTATSASPGSFLIQSSTGRVFRKTDSGSSTNWEHVAPTVYCSAYSTAGNIFVLANTTYFVDFPTIEADTNSAILGAGNGLNVTYTNTWRYVCPYAGYYLVSSIVQWTSNSAGQNFFSSVYLNGVAVHGGNNSNFNVSAIRDSVAYAIVKAAKNDIISIGAQETVANKPQTTTGPANKVVIALMCRS